MISRQPPRRKYSTWPFWATLFIVTCLTIYSFSPVAKRHQASQVSAQHLFARDGASPDLECRLVHDAHDKCEFVKHNCPDEEAGLISYLRLYYCDLPHAKPVAFTIIVLWLCMLFATIGIAASDFFCLNLSSIANLLGMSDSLTGVTFLAFGNGSPDIFSTFAAMNTNSGSLAVGELIGAASFITAVVAGSIAFIRPFKVPKKAFIRDISFFIVATIFSLIFLYDGHIHLWESVLLVALYVFYVAFVLVWHWWMHRRKTRRAKEVAARGQFITPGHDEITQEYHDEPEDEGDTVPRRSRPGSQRVPTMDDLAALERQGSFNEVEDDDDHDERYVGEGRAQIARKMRVSRPRGQSRATSGVPIRPSLAGALEFRSVLSDLQRSRNIQNVPIILRRYSDDGRTEHVAGDHLSMHSDPHAADRRSRTSDASSVNVPQHAYTVDGRMRSASVNNMAGLHLDTTFLHQPQPQPEPLIRIDDDDTSKRGPRRSRRSLSFKPPSPVISISVSPTDGNKMPEPILPVDGFVRSPSLLAPPDLFQSRSASPARSDTSLDPLSLGNPARSPLASPSIVQPEIADSYFPSKATPPSPFPTYRDDPNAQRPRAQSLVLPAPGVSFNASLERSTQFITKEYRLFKWWPYQVLPSPWEIFETLFPTIASWHDKGIFGKIAGVVVALPIFLLKVTLPVVETERGEGEEDEEEDLPAGPEFGHIHPFEPSLDQHHIDHRRQSEPLLGRGPAIKATAAPESAVDSASTLSQDPDGTTNNNSPTNGPEIVSTIPIPQHLKAQLDLSPQSSADPWTTSENKDDWHRWLVMVQCVISPLFIVLVLWANTEPDNPRALWESSLISLLCSAIALLLILTTTTPLKPPKWRLALCFLGFAVSIAWISTIANEVVGVLKTLGVILNISDAILGLTIFAVGSSLGDLVANVTVARLGLPNMALSACFGGPMLNILLGIGLSGMYLTIKNAEDRTHRGKKLKFKPYHIEVNRTLMISGGCLLVTLVMLVIVVPMRGWRMDRKIGWALMGFWGVTTVANVVVEVLGLAKRVDK